MKKRLISMVLCVGIIMSLMVTQASAIVSHIDWSIYDFGYVDAPAGVDLSAIDEDRTALKVTVNNEPVEFTDAQPFVDKNNRTLIPVRFVTEAMEADVSWDQNTQTALIQKGDVAVEITIGKKNIKVTEDGTIETVTMDTAAVAKDGRTFVPIRFVAEALGAVVDWSSLYNVVEIIYSDELTAEEITRLRSYPLLEKNNYGQDHKEALMRVKDFSDHSSFAGNYGFSNAHFFSWLNTNIDHIKYVQNDITGEVLMTGRPSGDYAAAMVQYAKNHIETTPYLSLVAQSMYSDDMSRAIYSYGMSGSARVCKLHTIDSLCYREPYGSFSSMSVRGIMDVTFYDPYPLESITEDYGIENPEYGVTYSIDVDLRVFASQYRYLSCYGEFHLYRFDPVTGERIKI